MEENSHFEAFWNAKKKIRRFLLIFEILFGIKYCLSFQYLVWNYILEYLSHFTIPNNVLMIFYTL